MITIDANRTHPGFTFRLAMSIAILKKIPIKIVNIRKDRKGPGLTKSDYIYAKILEQIGLAESKGINVGSTEIVFKPTTIKSAQRIVLRAPTTTSVLLPHILLIYHESKQNIRLLGPTSAENKLSVDYFHGVIIPLLKKINVKTGLDIVKRGYFLDSGKIILKVKPSSKYKDLDLLKKGDLEHIDVCIHSYGFHESINEYIKEGIKKNLNNKNIRVNDYKSIFVENNEKQKGFGADAILTYEHTLLGTNVCAKNKQPTHIGKELADKIVSLERNDAPLDKNAGNIIVPFIAYQGLGCKIVYPKRDSYMGDCLYVCETLLGTKYKKEDREKDVYLEIIKTRN